MYFLFLVLFSIFSLTYSSVDDIRVITNNLDTNTVDHVIATVFSLFENKYDVKTLAKNLVDEMDSKFGKTWICLMSKNNNNSVLYINQDLNSYISLTYEEIHIVLYKANLINNSTKNNILVFIYSIFCI